MSEAPKEIVAGSVPEIIEGGSAPAEVVPEVSGGIITGGAIEAGGRRKGGRNRSPRTRQRSRLMREVRRHSKKPNCPRGSRKDYRKGSKKNPSGCRRNDRSKSPRRSYHRKMTKAEKSSESKAEAEGAKVGHRHHHEIFKLEAKEGKHRKGTRYYVHEGKKVFATSRQFKRTMRKSSRK